MSNCNDEFWIANRMCTRGNILTGCQFCSAEQRTRSFGNTLTCGTMSQPADMLALLVALLALCESCSVTCQDMNCAW